MELVTDTKVEKIVVQGRVFNVCTETTFEQDEMIVQILDESGLDRLKGFDVMNDSFDDAARKLILRAFATGKLFLLLACMLEEEGVEWTVAMAHANNEFFRKLKKQEDKDALRGAIVGLILSFFVSGAFTTKHFQRYSLNVATNTDNATSPLEESFEVTPDTTSETGTT